jgi:hypothetical protein
MVYYTIAPWGPERADLNAGIIAAMIANVNRDPRKGEPIRPQDLMPKYGADPEPEMPSPDRLKAQLLEGLGSMIVRRKRGDGK